VTTTKKRISQRGRTALLQADPPLAKLIEQVGAYRLEVEPLVSVYEALTRSIVYQQLTGKAAATIFGRLCQVGDAPSGGTAPPSPSPSSVLGLDDSVLRGVGLSSAKTRAIKDLAARVDDGSLPDASALAHLDDDAIVAALTAVRGIGPWSVHMLLMFRLGRPDVLPAADYGVQKGFQQTFGTAELPSPKVLALRAERWRPHRTMASWYLWRALEL
jgi:DNA-3-methyladenine glycosylase II